ncbi:MAG: ribosome-associated translation inhibitor RaiA [Steroidobacteraceae bacterium]
MHLSVTGHHIEITASMRSYVEKKMERIVRHFENNLIDAHFILTVDKLEQKAEATLHVRGETVHVVATDTNMYAAIDSLVDKLDNRVRKHKEKVTDHHAAEAQKSARA